jgi:nucleoside-diphosphate-sugar epimerase/pimeloyl-ACP methyl ester carboxylesterase
MAHVFITGGTGFIGMHTLQELSRYNHTISVLVRSRNKWESVCRQMELEAAGSTGRIKPVFGDLSAPNLGLSNADMELVEDADVVIHAGGPMNILLGEGEARSAFLHAADEVLALSSRIHRRKGLRHLIHLVGFKSPFNDENMTDPEPIIARLQHKPPYERMKFLADLRIRQGAMKEGFPLSVVNLGAVIGSSKHGDTPQTGGLGILVSSTARKLMGLVPGGKSYRIPFVHVDHTAEFITALAGDDNPANGTYYLMDEKQSGPTMTVLAADIAKELRVGKPFGSISLPLLSKVLSTPLGGTLGIPKESLDFIVDEEYPLEATRRIHNKFGLRHAVNRSILPFVIADLDFRIVHSHFGADGYIRNKRGPLATIERAGRVGGSSPTIVFVHGLLSGSDCFVPLAEQFPDSSVCLVDLPGFGRSPYHHQPDVLEGHIESLVQAIQAFEAPIALVGHSLGGLLAAKAWERIPECISELHLLQPVLHTAPQRYRSARMTEAVLRRLNTTNLQKQLMLQTCFDRTEDIPATYFTYILEELRSPRISKTTAETLAMLTKRKSFGISGDALSKERVSILWGENDRMYRFPEKFLFMRVSKIGAAHNFPIAQPEWTAKLLKQQGLQ